MRATQFIGTMLAVLLAMTTDGRAAVRDPVPGEWLVRDPIGIEGANRPAADLPAHSDNPTPATALQGKHQVADGTFAHSRYRVLNLALGRFMTRDPIGYQGGSNSYNYVADRPVALADRSGLLAIPGGGLGKSQPIGSQPYRPSHRCFDCPSGQGRQRHPPDSGCDACCNEACLDGSFGVTVCCGKTVTSCICEQNITHPLNPDLRFAPCFQAALRECIEKHESLRRIAGDCSKVKPCEIAYRFPSVTTDCEFACQDCRTYGITYFCIANINCNACDVPLECERNKSDMLQRIRKRLNTACEDCFACNADLWCDGNTCDHGSVDVE